MEVVTLLPCGSQGACAWESEALPPSYTPDVNTVLPPALTPDVNTLWCSQLAREHWVWGNGGTGRLRCGQNCGPAVPILLTYRTWELWEGTGLAVCSESVWGALLELCQQQPQLEQLTTGPSGAGILLSDPLSLSPPFSICSG